MISCYIVKNCHLQHPHSNQRVFRLLTSLYIYNILILIVYIAHLLYVLKLKFPCLKLRNLGQQFHSSLSQRVSELDALPELLIIFQLVPHVVMDGLVNFEDVAIVFL